MDNWRWIIDCSCPSISFPIWRYCDYVKLHLSWDHLPWFQATKLQCNQICREQYRNAKFESNMLKFWCWIYSKIGFQVNHLQHWDSTLWNHTTLFCGGGKIFTKEEISTGIATPTVDNYSPRCGTTKNPEVHPSIVKAMNIQCTWERTNNCTLRIMKSTPRELMANTHTDESRSSIPKLQSQMRSWLSLGNPEIHSC